MWVLDFLPPDPSAAASQQLASQASTQKANTPRGPYYLVAGTFIVGRKDCDILLDWDRSVSRRHAELVVNELDEEEVGAVGTMQTITITDLGAKFKTFVNDKQLAPNEPRVLQAGDRLTFGNCIKARLRPFSLVLCLSRISGSGKNALRQAAARVGAHVVDKWRPTCTHLVVEQSLTATIKVAFAVINKKAVVDVGWLTDGVINRPSLATPLPDPSQYKPDWSGITGVRQLDRDRKELFKSYLFVFVAADETEDLVQDSGGLLERAYRWTDVQLADIQGTITETLRRAHEDRGGVRRTCVLMLPETTKDANLNAFAEQIKMVPDVYITLKRHIASAIFRNSSLKGTDNKFIPQAPSPAPALAAAAAPADAAPLSTMPPPQTLPRTTRASEPPPPPPPPSESMSIGAGEGTESLTVRSQELRETHPGGVQGPAQNQEQDTKKENKKQNDTGFPPVSLPGVDTITASTATPAAAPAATVASSSPARRSTRQTAAAAVAAAATPGGSTTRSRTATTGTDASSAGSENGSAGRPTKKKRRLSSAAEEEVEGDKEQENPGADGGATAAALNAEDNDATVEKVTRGRGTSSSKQASSKSSAKNQEKENEKEHDRPTAMEVLLEEAEEGGQKEGEGERSTTTTTSTTTTKATVRRGRSGKAAAEVDDDDINNDIEEEMGPLPPAPAGGIPNTENGTAATDAVVSSTSSSSSSRNNQRPFKMLVSEITRLDPKEGWLVAPRKAPVQQHQISAAAEGGLQDDGDDEEEEKAEEDGRARLELHRRKKRRGTAADEEEDDEVLGPAGDDEENDGPPVSGRTLVEERDLLGNSKAHDTYLASPAAARVEMAEGGGHNFKRFRKNRVRRCDGQEKLKKTMLMAVLPKESEMELQLRNEDMLELARKEEGERLFEDEDAGPKRRKFARR